MKRYYQAGGQEQQLMQLFQIFADTVQDDEFSTAEEVMQMFQELSPEEQQAFVQQAMQIVQQEQSEAPQEEQMELEEEPTMQLGGYVNNTGYLEGYETSKNPFNIIPSKSISMHGVDPKIKYIKGTDNLGNTQYMEHGGEYEFDGDFVVEEPVYAQTGRKQSAAISDISSLLEIAKNKKTAFKNKDEKFAYNNYLEYLNKLNQKAKLLGDKIKNTDFEDEKLNYTQQLEDISKKANLASPSNVKTKVIDLGRGVYVNDYIIDEPIVSKKIKPLIAQPLNLKDYKSTFIPNTDIEVLKQPKEGYYIGSDGNQYYSKDKGKSFEITKDYSPSQDKPKFTILSKKANKAIAEQVATPEVLPPPVPTETVEGNMERTPDFRIPLFDKGNYYIPQEDREIEINPQVFNRTNIGVGKRFFKKDGGYAQVGEINFNNRFNPNAGINIGAETEQQFYTPYTNKMRLFPNISTSVSELEPINQYDSLPMGANSMNYQAPNAESKRMFEGRSSDQLLDLGNYADRFGVEHFDTRISQPQSISKKQSFLDKFGKKSDLSFNPNTTQLAPYYNFAKASEPLADQYRPNVSLKYAETPLLDPLPVMQELYNQQRLATQNINTNSPTGQAYLSNLSSQTQQKVVELMNDVQQKNAQIAAQNEAAKVNAYNQEQQLNIAANQQYLQNQLQAQANKDLLMGESLSAIDQMQANRVRDRNNYNSLAAITPGLKKSNNWRDLITGSQSFEIDPRYKELQYLAATQKTPEQLKEEQRLYQEALKKANNATVKQVGGLNSFFKKRIA